MCIRDRCGTDFIPARLPVRDLRAQRKLQPSEALQRSGDRGSPLQKRSDGAVSYTHLDVYKRQPFYRADKSRNRNSGGSGLGLYITKTILDHHEIIYNMVNTENGVKFTAFLW